MALFWLVVCSGFLRLRPANSYFRVLVFSARSERIDSASLTEASKSPSLCKDELCIRQSTVNQERAIIEDEGFVRTVECMCNLRL